MPKSDIPFGSEFGPNQVGLVTVLRLAQAHPGDGNGFTRAVAAHHGWPEETAKNTRLGLHSYGLLQNDNLTEIGQHLLALANDPPAMYEDFARHILLRLRGLEVVTAIDAMQKAKEPATLTTISRYLKPLGIYVPPTGTHLSKLRGWLGKAGVFANDRGFGSLDMARVREIIGVSSDSDIDFVAEMPEDQRAFLKALANLPMTTIPDETPLRASEVVDYAAALYGATFNEKGIVRVTLTPLQDAGFITIDKPPKATGQEAGSRKQISGKSTLIYRTEKFANDYLVPLIDALGGTGLAVRQLMRKPLAEILDELKSDDRNIKGKAIEALAFYFMRLLDLEFRAWRHRGKETGGAEVDMLAESAASLVFARWQIVCKNTDQVALDEVAAKVGLSPCLNTSAILILITGHLMNNARNFVDSVLRSTNLSIIVLEQDDLTLFADSPLMVKSFLKEKAHQAVS